MCAAVHYHHIDCNMSCFPCVSGTRLVQLQTVEVWVFLALIFNGGSQLKLRPKTKTQRSRPKISSNFLSLYIDIDPDLCQHDSYKAKSKDGF